MLQWKFTLKSHCLNTAKAYCLLILHIHFWAHMRVWPLLHWVTQYWRLMAFPLTRPVQVGIFDLLLREGSTYTPSVFISELVTWPHLIGNYSKALGITASCTRNERRIRHWCITNVYDTLSDELVIISKTKLSTLWYRIKASLYSSKRCSTQGLLISYTFDQQSNKLLLWIQSHPPYTFSLCWVFFPPKYFIIQSKK